MAVGQVVVVVGAVQVGGHGAGVLAAVLRVVGLAHLDAGDLGDGVGLVGRLQCAGQQVFLLDGLGRQLRVDAARAQEHQPLHPGQMRAVDQVVLDRQILVDEVGPVRVVGLDAPHLGRRDEDVVGLVRLQVGVHRGLVHQVQLLTHRCQHLCVPPGLQPAHQRRAHHATGARDQDGGVLGNCVHRGAHSWWSNVWKPASLTSASRLALVKSACTISATSSLSVVLGTQPSFSFALVGSPSRVSTSVGRK